MLLLVAFLPKAAVPVGMMLDIKSFAQGGDLVTICPSVGELPWMTRYVDHSGHDMAGVDENADARCPFAALDAPVAIASPEPHHILLIGAYEPFVSLPDQHRSAVLKPAARAPPTI